MTIPNCPHCYRRVIPSDDGICPACQRNMNEASGSDPNKVLITLAPRDKLPGVCHECGSPTRHLKKLSVSSEPEGTFLAGGVAQRVLGHLLDHTPLGLFNRLEQIKNQVVISLALPTCERCVKKIRSITPRYIDFDSRRVDVLVHKEFKKALTL